jgi:hypothetical protein
MAGALGACKKYGDSQASDIHAYESNEESDPSKEFTLYKDSLKKYFRDLEVKLIRQYHINHEKIKNLDDFYHFFANSIELQRQLNESLKDYTKKHKLKSSDLPEMAWFSEIAKGLMIKKNETGTGVYLDYDDFKSHASITNETGDDKFVKLLEVVYEPNSVYPKWLKIDKSSNYCSNLGSGQHLKALKLVDEVLLEAKIFENELIKIQKMALYDVLKNKYFCLGKKQVIDEIEMILKEVDTKKTTENEIRTQLEVLKKSPEFKFGCMNVDCN